MVGGRFGAEQDVITHVLFEKAISLVTADDRIRQIQIFHDCLKLASIWLGNPAAEDDGDLVRLPDGSMGVQKPFSHLIQGRSAAEDQVIAVFDWSEKQAVLTACLLAFALGKKGRERGEPFLAAGKQVAWGERIGQFL